MSEIRLHFLTLQELRFACHTTFFPESAAADFGKMSGHP